MTAATFAPCLPAAVSGLTEATSLGLAASIRHETLPYAGGLNTSFALQGRGEPLLCLHGFDSSCFEFRRLLPQLADHAEARALDFLGFGFTERRPDLTYSPDTIREHLHACWQQWYGQPIVLVGASMGGAVAIDFALHHPEAVKGLILLDGAGVANGPVLGRYLFSPLDRWAVEFLRRADVRRNISIRAYHRPEVFVTPDAELCAALHLQCPDWDEALRRFTRSGGYGSYRTRLGELRAPSLVLWGRQDRILGTKDAAVFERELPDARLVWIEEAGHVPHLEQPEATAIAIREWLQTL